MFSLCDKKMTGIKKTLLQILPILLVFLYGCAGSQSSKDTIFNEIVFAPGDKVIVQADWTNIEISSLDEKTRNYTWNGKSIKVELLPRAERWNGSLGLYHPHVKPPHEGVVHMVVEEGQQHFKTLAEALYWITLFGDKPIYRDDGLLIASDISEENSKRKFVNIYVMQIYINGQKPTKLPGSQNNRIKSI